MDANRPRNDLVAIGEFSRLCGLSVKMLRHYHDLGLLEPAAVHPVTGYRMYRRSQASRAAVIRELRELGMPLGEIRGVLEAEEGAEVRAIIGRYRARLIDGLAVAQRRLARIESFVREEHAMLDHVLERELPRLHVVTRRFEGPTDAGGPGRLGTEASDELRAVLVRDAIAPVGPPVLLAHRMDEDGFEAELCIPIPEDAKTSADVVVRDLGACRAAVTRHAGRWEEAYLAIQSLIAWVAERGHTPVPPVRAYILAVQDAFPVTSVPAGAFESVCDYAVVYE